MAKVGRNDPCPCGSGKKYKKCCLEREKPLELPKPSSGFSSDVQERGWVTHTGSHIPFASEDYLTANPDSPIARMELLAREAEEEESRGHSEKAYDLYRKVLAMAPDEEMKCTVLQDLEMLCMNNPAVLDRGAEVSRELEELALRIGNADEASQAAAQRADFLEELGRTEEALAEFRRALAAYPESPWLWIHYARFLAARGEGGAALRAYEEALRVPDAVDAHGTARSELDEIAANAPRDKGPRPGPIAGP
jgi:tetratricopeptide (TPR) repeat protein